MDTTTGFVSGTAVVLEEKSSRLPAGSVLKVGDIYVPHPHAEVNLPGAGDPRLGDTKAVTEFRKADEPLDAAPFDPAHGLTQEPLHDAVKPKVVTVADANTATPTDADKQLEVEKPTPTRVA